MVNRSVQPDGTIRFEDERGVAFLRMLRPGVPLLTYTGHIKADFYDALVVEYKQELERARRDKRQLVILADGWELKGMDTAYRERWVQWIKENRAYVATILALLHSRQVVMAANIMSMLIGRGLIRTYADPKDFEEAIELAVPGLGWHWKHVLGSPSGTEGGAPLHAGG
ncbi:MAG TPA: hypothetical protein VH877_02795 [Polyangia bacterium]|jgi:hypothetical protein|nr:hypothetical protein [Polyangia bacterium]